MSMKWTVSALLLFFFNIAHAVDECADVMNSDVCTTVQQTCSDPTPADPAASDWTCVCPLPSSGSATAMAATCTLNECTATCPTCAKTMSGDVCSDVGQTCVDQNQAWDSTGNWACLCPPGSDGKASYLSVAICSKNECEDQTNYNICFAKHQLCNDPNHLLNSTNDWECVCTDPGVGRALQTTAVCQYDECVDKFAVCASAGQMCVDPNMTLASLRDWKCACTTPSTGEEVGSVAVCTYPAGDECTAQSVVCNGPGQVCVDTDPTTPNNWECRCASPFNGTSIMMGATTCELDECSATCASCASTTGGNVCTDAGQDCYDKNKGALSLKDWQCSCRAPETGPSQPDAVAVCTLDECIQNAQTCITADQICVDPNSTPGSLGDWECRCKSPNSGTRTTSAVPSCTYNECTGPAKLVCSAEGQSCIDPNPASNSLDDWQCWCSGTANGNAVAGPANCTYSTGDECSTDTVCKNSKQQCIDPDFNVPNNWQCSCILPAVGTATTGKAASCELNECTAVCDTCADKGAGNVCTIEHQLCVDNNKGPSSVSDWECQCGALTTLPNSSPLGPALCEIDECVPTVARPNPCPTTQDCADPDKSPYSMTDWSCTCRAPAFGSGNAVPGVCTLDECIVNAYICSAASQICDDPNKDISSTDDWECICQTTGQEKAVMAQAVCVYDGECNDINNLVVCSQRGQTCRDPDPMTAGDWMCVCIPPQTGAPMIAAAAACLLDECIHQCNTCADTAHSSGHSYGNICTDAGQLCSDPNQQPTKTRDWVCSCIPPATGAPATNGVATCILDECVVTATSSVCDSIHQLCVDRNTAVDSLGDWECVCQTPWFGSQQAANATCELTPTDAPDTNAPPTPMPTAVPTLVPTMPPTTIPTLVPTAIPTVAPTMMPTISPTTVPTNTPGVPPTAVPTTVPTMMPTISPTAVPTNMPGVPPTAVPTVSPTMAPTMMPTISPTAVPTNMPGVPPTAVPTASPTTMAPTWNPAMPPTLVPTWNPALAPTVVPTAVPTNMPGVPPTAVPTTNPAPPTLAPTWNPALPPTMVPTWNPATQPTWNPATPPTMAPTWNPAMPPTLTPTWNPATQPTMNPANPPTMAPTWNPALPPTLAPTWNPATPPTLTPTWNPATQPTMNPANPPTMAPTWNPALPPTLAPTWNPATPPTLTPTLTPGLPPTATPPTSVPPLPSTAPPGTNCGLLSNTADCALDALCKWDGNACAAAAAPGTEDKDSNPTIWIVIITVILLICMLLIIALLYRLRRQKEKKTDEVHEREASEKLLMQEHNDKLREQEHEMSSLKQKAERAEALESENARLLEESKDKDMKIRNQDEEISTQEKVIEDRDKIRQKEIEERDDDENLRQSELLKSVANGRNNDMLRLTQGVNSGFGSPANTRSVGAMSSVSYPLSTAYGSPAPIPPTSPSLPQESIKVTLKPTGRARGL